MINNQPFSKFLWGLGPDKKVEQISCCNFGLKMRESGVGDGGSWAREISKYS